MQKSFFQLLATLLFTFPTMALADSPFDTCVNALYKAGGLSIRESQELCLKKPNSEQLSCQNNLFQIAFRTPQDSYKTCMTNPAADDLYKGQVYRGNFQPLPTGQKKTVCSITVNSIEERVSFKKMLPADKYDFVELLPEREQGRFITRDYHWLDRACEEKLRCDVLVLSGHFADSFIGDAGFEVSMRELKKIVHKNSVATSLTRSKKFTFLAATPWPVKNQIIARSTNTSACSSKTAWLRTQRKEFLHADTRLTITPSQKK